MSSRWSMLIVLVLTALPRPATAQEPTPVSHLFPRRAAIETSVEALVRLPLPAEVVARARPDLSDVRVFDANDAEVPYLIDRGDRPLPPNDPTPITSVLPRNASRGRADIFRYRERFELGTPGNPPPGAVWVLAIGTTSRQFVHAVRVASMETGRGLGARDRHHEPPIRARGAGRFDGDRGRASGRERLVLSPRRATP